MCPQTLTAQIPLSLWVTPPFSGLAGDDLGAWPQQGASAALEAASPPPPRAARRRREPGAEGLGVPQPEGRTGETAGDCHQVEAVLPKPLLTIRGHFLQHRSGHPGRDSGRHCEGSV